MINNNSDSNIDDKKIDFNTYSFLTKVRYYCIFGYCTSEEFTKEADYYIA
ncbi:hypothetical protein [Polaribacter ponticola]|uniref:Uncharacterized protein n=1 Tax=Polaribacter ponticola TaxID=2978475 RepID=A0ABT5SDE7_9FLAO|nr:hypothetical protein [Polaribacter sp. MSW5]MDD7915302.1 hypothetical protein [Polaribacter sp. MSW5]